MTKKDTTQEGAKKKRITLWVYTEDLDQLQARAKDSLEQHGGLEVGRLRCADGRGVRDEAAQDQPRQVAADRGGGWQHT